MEISFAVITGTNCAAITNQLVVMMDPKMDEGYEPVVVYPLRVSLQLNLAAIKDCAERIRILI
jgi:hypothetical protein